MTAMSSNRVQSYVARLKSVADKQGPSAVLRMISASVLWRLSAENRQMQAVGKENMRFDALYGTDTCGEIPLEKLGLAGEDARRGNGIYRAIPESRFRQALSLLPITHSDFSFVDYGAGKGKALMLASQYPFRDVLGVEWSEALCEAARSNIVRFSLAATSRREIGVICGDATTFAPPLTPLVCFFFNPFDEDTWRAVLHRLDRSWDECPRPIHLVYVNIRNVREVGNVLEASKVFSTTTLTQHCWILSSPSVRQRLP